MNRIRIRPVKKARKNARVRARGRVRLSARRKPRLFSRKELGGGGWLINRYYRRGERGVLVPADIEEATHCERSVYDPGGNLIGTTVGPMTGGF